MSMNDTIADFLTRIRNAYRAGHEDVQVKYSKITERIAQILLDYGYLEGFEVVGEGVRKAMVVNVKYRDGVSVINGIKRISKPSGRIYVGYQDIKPVRNGLGMTILSTPAGVMSDIDARKKQLGGEVICNVW